MRIQGRALNVGENHRGGVYMSQGCMHTPGFTCPLLGISSKPSLATVVAQTETFRLATNLEGLFPITGPCEYQSFPSREYRGNNVTTT